MRCSRNGMPRAGFTIIELLVLLALLGLLIGLLIPALGSSRERARAIDCAARLRQLGIATNLYLKDSAGSLPQVLRTGPGGGPATVSPLLFGGKLGTVHQDGLDEVGPTDRPLNKYTGANSAGTSLSPAELEVFHSPADRGGILPDVGPIASTFDAFGTSYTYNDHIPRRSTSEPLVGTLIPRSGGPMPLVTTPDHTWLIGSHPIYNFDSGFDHQYRWLGTKGIKANLLMVDMHAESGVQVERDSDHGAAYTALPSPNWPEP